MKRSLFDVDLFVVNISDMFMDVFKFHKENKN